jgi:hypothetical protein
MELDDCTVPSLYGFFAGCEFVDIALAFYATVVGSADQELSLQIMRPFFLGPPLFLFFESVLISFCEMAIKGSQISAESSFLLDAIRLNCGLIPEAARTLFKLMCAQLDWRRVARFFADVIGEFLGIFLTSNRSHVPRDYSQKVIASLNRDTNFWPVLQQAFSETQPSIFQLPLLFDSALIYVISTRELSILVDSAATAAIGFPRSLSNLKTRFGGLTDGEFFTFRTFKRGNYRQQADPHVFLFFEDSEQKMAVGIAENGWHQLSELQADATLFERYLGLVHDRRALKKWHKVLSGFEYHVFQPLAYIHIEPVAKSEIDAAFMRLPSPFPHSRRLWREQFFALAEATLSVVVQPISHKIDSLTALWASAMQEYSDSREITKVFTRSARMNAFCRCVHGLQFVKAEHLSKSFSCVVSTARIIELIASLERNSPSLILKMAIALSNCRAFPRLYFIMSHGVINSECFVQLLNQQEMEGWVLFEKVIMESLTARPDLSELFFGLREAMVLAGVARVG